MNNKIVFILVILIIYILYNSYNEKLHFTQDIPNWTPLSTTHILITRFKEADISIILQPFINKKNTTIFIYNKSNDIPLGIPLNATNIKIIQIPNLGWDAYGYLYHVINNYYYLPDYIYNIHASAQYLNNKYKLYNDILDNKHNDKHYYGGELVESDLNFFLNDWTATYQINKIFNPNEIYSISSVRPIKKWLTNKIKNIPEFIRSGPKNFYHNWGGMFFVHKSKILLYSIKFYIEIFNEISVWQSEVNHYLERSWYAFYGN